MIEGSQRTIPFRTGEEQRAALPAVIGHLRAGGLIACPTETVYGLSCTLRPDALARLAAVKGREYHRPFLLLVSDRNMLSGVEWTAGAAALADAFWPGPLTLALRTTGDSFPPEVVSRAGTVAMRATPHAGMRMVVEACGEPVTSTSANLPGGQPAEDAGAAAAVLVAAAGDWPVLVLDGGKLPPSPPSTIVDCSTEPPRLVRAGVIDVNALSEIINGIEPIES